MVTVLVLVVPLYLSAFLPQDRILENARASAEMLVQEGAYPQSGDYAPSTMLDNWTDALMLNLSAAMNREDMEAVWTNAYYGKDGSKITADDLHAYAHGEPDMNKGIYPRYWMGFRWTLRLALTLFNYAQLRRVISLLFFSLLALAAGSVAKHVNRKTAFLFALSVIFVRPQIISNSLQFTTCFFLALPAMLLVPALDCRRQWEKPFFLLLGMLTMYFDFYTYPILCLGYPLVYLYLLRLNRGERMRPGSVLGCCGVWFAAWLLMWLTKLSLTSLLSSADGFGNGFAAMLARLGPDNSVGGKVPLSAVFTRLRWCIFPDGTWMALAMLGIAAGLGYLLLLRRRGAYDFLQLLKNPVLLILALLPLLWFSVAAEPSYVHAWFQYRSIAMSYWAFFALISTGFSRPEKRSE